MVESPGREPSSIILAGGPAPANVALRLQSFGELIVAPAEKKRRRMLPILMFRENRVLLSPSMLDFAQRAGQQVCSDTADRVVRVPAGGQGTPGCRLHDQGDAMHPFRCSTSALSGSSGGCEDRADVVGLLLAERDGPLVRADEGLASVGATQALTS